VAEPGTRRFGRFTVLDVLGTGAMGEVLRARDERLGREVAIKTVRNVFGMHADTFKQRFDAEARALAALSHPAIVQVHDLGFDDGSGEPYLVMELVDGPSLKAKLQKDGTMSAADVRGLGIQLARALEAAHARGILHRDIKPANILLAPTGQWKLADFGVAHVPESSMTMTGQFLGTPAYAAPESMALAQFSEASDIFSVAVTLIEALTGERLRGDASLMDIVQHARDTIRLPAGVPSDLEIPLRAALALDPAARPTAARLAELMAGGSTAGLVVAAVAPPIGGDATAVLTGPVRAATPTFTPGPAAPFVAGATTPGSIVEPLPADRGDAHRRRRIGIAGAVAAAVLTMGLVAALSRSDHRQRAGAGQGAVGEKIAEATDHDDLESAQREFDGIVEDAQNGNVDEALEKLDEFEQRHGESEATQRLREDLRRAFGPGHGRGRGKHKKHW